MAGASADRMDRRPRRQPHPDRPASLTAGPCTGCRRARCSIVSDCRSRSTKVRRIGSARSGPRVLLELLEAARPGSGGIQEPDEVESLPSGLLQVCVGRPRSTASGGGGEEG
jgi:hypothetical protein